MKVAAVLLVAIFSALTAAAASESVAKDYAEAEERIEAASVRFTGMRTQELGVALSRDWVGKKKRDLALWIEQLPKESDAAWLAQNADREAIVFRISTEYPAGSELSAVFRFWLSSDGIIERVQHYRDHTKEKANQ